MRFPACVLLALALSAPVSAQASASTRDSGDAAHLFAYWPKKGMEDRFDQGYRAHLRWHREKRDPLVWYGWYVYDGERAGMFIDGSFGAPFAAFDRRVDPAGDGADAGRNVTPNADTAFRASYRLRRELSTGVPLEQWRPSKSVQVFHYTLHPGTTQRFEAVLRAARAALQGRSDVPPHTWYEKLVGGAVPQYMLMIARDDWSSYDRYPGGLDGLLDDPTHRIDLAGAVAEVRAETWNYRADLSLVPED
ncbi:hypothetical protein IP90_00581 [Luteimonas cucumeris]|uniref:NIPSNAP protein n=1 Tax=Luteimonas cucumeris TaxID=985012 RepID=A0A562LFE4_9GAMM|nr:hypothetical protein [Luteimonas cucumeris]TWI06315.1 hypothetical protein IP90_00581 [Luteimonas cucumeris]